MSCPLERRQVKLSVTIVCYSLHRAVTSMLKILKSFFATSSFIPHGHCYLWQPQLVGLHIVSDLLIGLAYYSIPIMLVYFVHKRQDTPFQKIFLMFGAFIIACGTTHLMAIWTLWHPDYWLFGGIKLITALISLYTAIELLTLFPQALALPHPAQLEATNQKLAAEILVSDAAIKHRLSAEAALKQSESRLRLIFDYAAIPIALADITGELVTTNPAFQKMLGYSQNELSGMHFKEFTHPECLTVEEALFEEMRLGQRDCYQIEKRYFSKSGQVIWVNLTVSLVQDAQGKPQYCIALVENITQRKQAEAALRHYQEHLEELVAARTAELLQVNEQLSWQAGHDSLTGLVNRREFEKCLEKVVCNARTCPQESTLCYLDLDHFKIINDTCGHLAGDELLRQISCLLQSCCRKTDTLARLGGDEFGLLLYQCSLDEAMRVVQALHEGIQQFQFVWQDHTFRLGVSIGIVAIDTYNLNLEDILNAADTACYTAKHQGRNQVHIYQLDNRELQQS